MLLLYVSLDAKDSAKQLAMVNNVILIPLLPIVSDLCIVRLEAAHPSTKRELTDKYQSSRLPNSGVADPCPHTLRF